MMKRKCDASNYLNEYELSAGIFLKFLMLITYWDCYIIKRGWFNFSGCLKLKILDAKKLLLYKKFKKISEEVHFYEN